MSEFRLPVGDGTETLAVQFDRPGPLAAARLCLVAMHGFGSDQTGEKIEHFRQGARTSGFGFCSFDFRGHGSSDGSMSALSLSRNLEDLGAVVSFLEREGLSKPVLLGSSMGALTGMWFAAREPRRVLAAMHIAPALWMGRGFEHWAGTMGLEAWQRDGKIRYRTEWLDVELGWPFLEDLRKYGAEDLRFVYHTPTLILQGMQDEMVPWRKVIEFAEKSRIAEIEAHLIKDGDHRMSEHKEALWNAMLSFLQTRVLGAG